MVNNKNYKIRKWQNGYIVTTPGYLKIYCETLAEAKAFIDNRIAK